MRWRLPTTQVVAVVTMEKIVLHVKTEAIEAIEATEAEIADAAAAVVVVVAAAAVVVAVAAVVVVDVAVAVADVVNRWPILTRELGSKAFFQP